MNPERNRNCQSLHFLLELKTILASVIKTCFYDLNFGDKIRKKLLLKM